MTKDKDITSKVKAAFPEDEYLPIMKCACGETFEHWGFTISMDKEDRTECPACGRNLRFTVEVKVFEVVE